MLSICLCAVCVNIFHTSKHLFSLLIALNYCDIVGLVPRSTGKILLQQLKTDPHEMPSGTQLEMELLQKTPK